MTSTDFRFQDVNIQRRVSFGEGSKNPKLAGMLVMELFVTAKNAVPCHIIVAMESTMSVVLTSALQPPDTPSVFIISKEGVAQRFDFQPRRGQWTTRNSLCLVNHCNVQLGVEAEEFPNSRYNDTAYVFFGRVGYHCLDVYNANKQAHDAFKLYAGLSGVSYIKEQVVEEDFKPKSVHKLAFAPSDGKCTREHVVHVWSDESIKQWTEPDGVATLSDAAGNQIRFQHRDAPGNGWDMCLVCVKDKSPVEGMDVNMPVCIMAPFQVAFPDTPFPGYAAAMRRHRLQERKAEYEKHKAAEAPTETRA